MKNVIDAITSLEHKSCAALTVQCLANSGVVDWQTAYDLQITNAKKLGLMPDDFKVIRETLQNLGFAMQSTAVEGVRADSALSMIGRTPVPAIVFLQLSDYQHLGGYMAAVQIEGDQCTLISSLPRADSLNKRWVNHVWIRWRDGVDRSPYPRKVVKRGATSSKRRNFPETPYFVPFQPNPCKNYIGDCVVRATAGAMGISWEAALDALSAMHEVTVNAREVYPYVLEKHGFIHHNPILHNGRRLDGKTFCEEMNRTYHNGERIFAHVGRLHVAAIVPIPRSEGGNSYKIIDSWDSSARLMGEYWVLPAKVSDAEKVGTSSAAKKSKQSMHVGDWLHHPTFGKGVIAEVARGILSIDFGANGKRRLSEDWVRKHCSPNEPSENMKSHKVAQTMR